MARIRKRSFVDQNLIRALAHPLRREILEVLNEQEASPNIVSGLLDEKLYTVSYHTRVLNECGVITLTRTEPRRGATENFYRALPESSIGHKMLKAVPASLRGSVTLASFKAFVGKLVSALQAGTIDDQDDTALSSMNLAFDSEGRADAADVIQDTLARLKAIDEQSRKRVATNSETLSAYVSGVALFAAAPPDIR